MRAFLWVARITLLVLAVAMFAFALGTMVPSLPLVGSIGGFIILGGAHIVLLGCAILVLALVLLAIGNKQWIHGLTALFLAITFVLTAVCLSAECGAFREAGANVSVWHTVRFENTKSVTVQSVCYDTSDAGEVLLDVYTVPDDAVGKPVVVYIHGGGWIAGDRGDHTYYSKVYAKSGCVAVSVDYDLSTAERHLAATCEKQLARAFAWVRDHVADYGGDVSRLYVTGDSAGGNLALEMAYKINGGMYGDLFGALPAITAVAVTYPVADPALFWQNEDLVLGAASKRMCTYYTGTTPDEDAVLYASIKPANFITAQTPPTLVIVGAGDTQVQPAQSYDLAEALENAHRECQLVKVPYANHAFDNVDGSIGCQGVLQLTLDWFAAHQ